MSTKWQPVQIPPGVVALPTKNQRSSNWAEVNLMRWVEGELQPVGGQAQIQWTDSGGEPVTNFASRCKMIHGWYDLNMVYHVAYVCEQNVYIDTQGTLTEITPDGGWPAPPMPGQGGYGDLDYNDDNYGTPRASSSIRAVDQIPDAWSVDNFGALLIVMYSEDGRLLMWDPAATANVDDVQTLTTIGSPTGGTFTLTFGFQATDPNNPLSYDAAAADVQSALEALTNVGSGNVTCSGGPLPAAITVTFQGSLGDQLQPLLVGSNNNLSGGTGPAPSVVHTTPGANVLLSRVGGSPMGRCFVVTQERFVMIFGMTQDGTADGGSFRRFGWCNQEDPTAWDFSNVVSQAGYLDIEPASPIITALSGRFGTLFFTGKKAYVSRYLGLPYIYDYLELADNCTPWSPASICATSSYLLWMADEQGMFSFDGTTIMPIACQVRPWITDDIDPANVRQQACAVHVSDYNEFWWFYPQDGQPYNTRCVIYNYKEGWWSQGQMSRSAGVSSSYTVEPIMADGAVAFLHESSNVYGNAALPWAETFDLNLTSGVRLATLKQVIPDIHAPCSASTAAANPATQATAIQNVQFQFYWKNSRSLPAMGVVAQPGMGQATPGQWGAPVPLRPDGYVDARVTGRDIRMRISTIGPTVLPFTVGQHLVDFAVRGDR